MIYLNGKEWDGWKEELGKAFKLKKSTKFYLCSQYQGEKIVDDKKVVTYPESMMLPTAFTVIKNGVAVELRYVTKPTARIGKDKNPTMEYGPEGVIFRNGTLMVKKNELDLYYWMVTHPRCETNREYFTEDSKGKLHADDSKVTLALSTFTHFIFRERNEVLEQEISYDKNAEIIKAKNIVVSELTEKEAFDIYKAYNEPDWDDPDLAISRVKNFLLAKAEIDPKEFLGQLDGDARTYKTKVTEAVSAEVLFFDKRKRQWKFAGPDNAENKILVVSKGVDETKALIEFLRDKDSGELYDKISELVKAKEEEALA